MDFCRNVSVPGGEYHQPEQPFSAPNCSANLDDLFSTHNTEVDVSLEWLSVFVEDCLTSTGNCLPAAPTNAQPPITTTTKNPEKPTNFSKPSQQKSSSSSSPSPYPLHKFVVPGKARSKRKRATAAAKPRNHFMSWNHQMPSSDPPMLQQAYWLADSELILPKKEEMITITTQDHDDDDGQEIIGRYQKRSGLGGGVEEEEEKESLEMEGCGNGGQQLQQQNQQQQARRCSHCLAQRTPQWRAGPLGPKTLCNACGVRYKSGRLLPEYRPAKSPTFVSYLHSNSHKKVLEMRNLGGNVQ